MQKRKTKIKVGILSGGPSPEHAVSLVTAVQVKKHLNRAKYEAFPIKISKSGQWPKDWPLQSLRKKIDIAFIAMHGAYGEDGIVQALLEAHNVPYTGSGVLASALAMDKWRSGLVAQALGVPIPYTLLAMDDNLDLSGFGNKVVIKPNDSGSSVGVQVIDKARLKASLRKAPRQMLVQQLILGREFTVSVFGNVNPRALPVIEIITKAKFYDYHSKYEIGGSEHIVPAKISKRLTVVLQTTAVSMHIALGCQGVSRSDFIVSQNGKVYYLETNTIPGMTPTSLLPQAAAAAGMSFSELLDMIIGEILK